jgi:hypothetical protein
MVTSYDARSGGSLTCSERGTRPALQNARIRGSASQPSRTWSGASRGEGACSLRQPDASLAPPSAAGCLRGLQGEVPDQSNRGLLGPLSGARNPQSEGLCEGAERERGERSLDSVGVSLMSSGSQFVLQKNQIRPVNEAGRAVGFFPVTSCSLGKRQPDSELRFTPLGCLFACGRSPGRRDVAS